MCVQDDAHCNKPLLKLRGFYPDSISVLGFRSTHVSRSESVNS